jgi:hypothetical protein
MGPSVLTAFTAVALPLGVTVCIETAVAASFGLRRQALGAVVWVNFVTNPLLNLVWLALFLIGVNHTWMWLVLVALEVAVIFSEVVILRAVVERQAASGRRLLTLCIVMNALSATLGTFLLGRLA